DKVFLMTKVCTHGRDKQVGLRQLEESLKRLQTDHLDLWQVHECVYDNDPERHFAKGGVIEALDEAKKAGKVRYVGSTGHKNLAIARGFQPMTAEEMEVLVRRCAAAAGDGHLELYKSTMKYDGDVGRGQHGLPPHKELPL